MYDPEITDLFRLLNPNNYQKGAWMLHMLRHLMGDERFFAGIRDYYEAFRDRNAFTADFQSVMERRAGRPLDWFFREWFNEPAYPIYDVRWHWDAEKKELQLRVIQKQEKTLFIMPLDVEIRTSLTPRHEIADVRERDQVFTFKLDQKPRGVVIDQDEWVLKVMTIREEK
jgi:aminopeptidase N